MRWWTLLAVLILQLLFNPCAITDRAGYQGVFMMTLNSLVVVAIIYRLSTHRVSLLIGLLLGIPIIILYWMPRTEDFAYYLFPLIGILYGVTITIMIPALLRHKEAGLAEMAAAASLYILLGLTWAVLYQLVEFVHPGSIGGGVAIDFSDLIYFSFTTLTTLGYGDITPISCEARTLSMLETLNGLFCLSIIVGRLIGIHTAQAMREKE